MTARLAGNALANVFQMVAGAALLLALYRYINAALGIEQLGVWSVVLATISASRIADFGLSSGVTRFVARDRARKELGHACAVVDTAALTLAVSVGAVLPMIHLLAVHILPFLFQGEHLAQARSILPYALISLWITIVATVFQGGLDGCERMKLRAGLVIGGQGFLLGLVILLVPQRGLQGLALAHIGQGVFLLVAGRMLLCRALPSLPAFPNIWRKRVLQEMLRYGVNVQVMTVFMLLFDPVAKALMAGFGGAAAAGYFEMANQVVLRARGIIVAANQAIVPHVAALAERHPERLATLYRQNMRVLAFVTLPTFAVLIAWAGGISWFAIGDYRSEFVFLLALLAVGSVGNLFAGPAYFTNMGSGRVGWNTLSHVIMGVANAGLGWLLGSRFGTNGVALGYVLALIAGSWFLIVAFQNRYALDWDALFAREHLSLAVASAAVAAIGWLAPLRPSTSDLASVALSLLLPPLFVCVVAWFHPVRPLLIGKLLS